MNIIFDEISDDIV